jgi:hypothetical protein
LILLVVASPVMATISVWQNDAGTGGDGGNWPDHPAPLRNRHGGSAGAYLGELYRYADEVDWYSFQVPGSVGSVDVAFTVQSDVPCETLSPDTTFVAQLRAPDGGAAGAPVSIDPCYSTGTLHVDSPAAGTWLLGFTLGHPDGVPANGPNGQTTVAAPTSSFLHLRYAFSVACDVVC